MTSATTHCPERIALATLAAWRDGALSPAEATRVAAHVPGCPGCRAELATYETLDAALRRYRAPEPDARLWNAVRGRMNGGLRSRPRGTPPRRLIGGLGALAAVVLLALGFAQVLHIRVMPDISISATPTPLPTAVPASPATNGPRLRWQQAQLPAEPLTLLDILTFGVAPSQGDSAYACHVVRDSNGATLTFFHTADRGLHWTSLTQLTEPGINAPVCMVQVDALDASRVLIQVGGYNTQTGKRATWYELSEDGGAMWTRLDESETIEDLATLNGKTYARLVRLDQPNSMPRLSVSTDHLRTWQPIDQSFLRHNQYIGDFWLSPSGELLAEVLFFSPGTSFSAPLWRSSDGGAHWEPFPAPTFSVNTTLPRFIVQQPTSTAQPWHVCTPYKHGSSAVSWACTLDGGRTWSTRPLLCVAAPCDPAFPVGHQYFLASDGAILALAPSTYSQLSLYRLPRDSATWQYLGLTAGSDAFFFFVPTPNHGVLWFYTGLGNLPVRFSGTIGLPTPQKPGMLATAKYP